MSATISTEVLLVDDQPETVAVLAKLVEANGVSRCRVFTPSDVSKSDLESADLVLVDYNLDEWLTAISTDPMVCRPPDGIAVAALLRQYSSVVHKAPPTGYALLTGEGNRFGHMPAERRPHVISRLNNLEWFFEKSMDQKETSSQVAELAKAIRSLPPDVKKGLGNPDALVAFLGVSEEDPLVERYSDAITQCRPPLHHLSERSHGLVVIRWLLHRILPHTCFLFDTMHLAARLRITPASFKKCIESDGEFAKALHPFRYRGPLASFDGPRWWRGGIEQWLWDQTNGESAHDAAVLKHLKSLGCEQLDPVGISNPVVTVNRELIEETVLSAFAEVSPLRLDDWPDYAEPAYATKQTLEANPEMQSFVATN